MIENTMLRFSRDLLIQGYTASHIETLIHTVPQFNKRFHAVVAAMDQAHSKMARTPDAYHVWDDLEGDIQSFLEFTNAYRGAWLSPFLAETA